jgi:hypothetical protein
VIRWADGRRKGAGASLVVVLFSAVVLMVGPLGVAAGGDSTLVGYNASALAIGAQFAFNVPNVVPLPNENLIEEDAPFSRTTVGGGPVVDAISAPYYPGDIAADLGSLLIEFGAPSLPINDPLLAQAKYPTSPGYPGHASFGPVPSVVSSTADASDSGGEASGTLSNLNLDDLGTVRNTVAAVAGKVANPVAGTKAGTLATALAATPSVLDVGNLSVNNNVTIGDSSITASATSTLSALDIAGLISIAGLTATASAASDGTTGTPSGTLRLGQVSVDGESAYIDGTGVHIASTSTSSTGITPAQLQQTVNATLAQDGISIRLLDPELTTSGAAASADSGGLSVALSHQLDVPYIPGEPTIPVPSLGNVGLPAGLYTVTTSLTFGLAQASVSATGLQPTVLPLPGLPSGTTTDSGVSYGIGGVSTFPSTGGLGTGSGTTQSLAPTGPGASPAGQASGAPTTSATDFPIRGVPPPIGWTIAALLACLVLAFPLLLVARWQFVTGRRQR